MITINKAYSAGQGTEKLNNQKLRLAKGSQNSQESFTL